MTCKEKLIADHPDWTEERIVNYIKNGCPSDCGYLEDPTDEDGEPICYKHCSECWDREIPETPPCGSEDVLDKLEHENEKEKENMCTCAKIIAYMNENQILKGHIEQLNKTNEDLANKLAAARAETERTVDAWEACSELRDNMAEKIAELEDRVFEQSREIEKMSDAHKIDVDTIRMLHARIEELNEANKNLRAEKDAMAAGKAKALAEKDRIIESRIEAINKLRIEVDDLTNRVVTQAESIKNLLESNDKMKEDIETKDKEIDILTKRDEASNEVLIEKNEEIDMYIKRLNEAEKIKEEQRKVINEIQARRNNLEIKFNSVLRQLEQAEKDINDLVDTVKAKDKRIQELCARIDKMDEEIYIKQDVEATKRMFEFFKQSRPIVMPKEEPTIRPINELPYARYASHIHMKYKALTDNGFSHDDAMALIPMWDDNEFEGFKHDGFRAAVTLVDEMHEYKEN